MISLSRHQTTVVAMSLLYICIGYAVTEIDNPITNYPIAFNMVVVVLSGIIFGKRTGFWTGMVAGIFALFFALYFKPGTKSPYFAIATMFPDALMGLTAGYLSERWGILAGSFAIIVGHTLNIMVFILTGLLAINLGSPTFWQAITYETLIDIVSTTMLAHIFLISFPFIRHKW